MRKLVLGATVAVMALVVAIPAWAASKVSGPVKLTTKQELASTGLKFDIKISNGTDGKPELVKRFAIALPKGTRFDGRGAARCDVTDAQVMEDIGKNCPANTKVGSGKVTATSDGSNTLTVDAVFYNLKPRSGPSSKAAIAIAFVADGTQLTGLDATGRGNKLISQVLTGELPGGFRVNRFRGSISKRSKGQRNLITSPAKCPKSRRWMLTTTFNFPSGPSKSPSKSPCNR